MAGEPCEGSPDPKEGIKKQSTKMTPCSSPYEGDSWESEGTKKETFSSQEREIYPDFVGVKEGIKKWRKMI
jgi:hypothetical protein